ncbi:DUF3299 domain-containing protein [Alteromonadaceae bacterium M269]|nr:DUF3299 domain-containing protein [Alteromonadaceae bacterium M269]
MTKRRFFLYTRSGINPIFALVLMLVTFCAVAESESPYTEIEWVALIPPDDLTALLSPPDFLSGIPDGSEQDSFDAFNQFDSLDERTRRFQEAMSSTKVIRTYENKRIRIPGFVVPLQSDDDKNAVEFFIVPYFGACLHMPPPPPNQIIYSEHKAGVKVENLYDPFWFEGTLKIETKANVLGTSAYKLVLDRVLPYEDE